MRYKSLFIKLMLSQKFSKVAMIQCESLIMVVKNKKLLVMKKEKEEKLLFLIIFKNKHTLLLYIYTPPRPCSYGESQSREKKRGEKYGGFVVVVVFAVVVLS